MNDIALAMCLEDPEAFFSGDDSSSVSSVDSPPSSPVSWYSMYTDVSSSSSQSAPSSSGWETASNASSSDARSLDDFSSPNTSFTEYSSSPGSSVGSDLNSVDWFSSTAEGSAPTTTVPAIYSPCNTVGYYSPQDVTGQMQQTSDLQSYQQTPSSRGQPQYSYAPVISNDSFTSLNSSTTSSCSSALETSQYQRPLSPTILSDLGSFFDNIGESHQQQCYGNQFMSPVGTEPSQAMEQGVSQSYAMNHQIQQNNYSNYTTTSTASFISKSPLKPSLKERQRGKPSETYVALIGKALLSSPNGRMTLTAIYDYITDNYEFYRSTALLWRNAVRHNLSINDCFIKAGRTEIGRGYYWAIHPSCVQDFKKGDFRRRAARSKVNRNQKKSPVALPLSVQQALQYQDCASTLQYHNQQISSSLHYQSYHHAAPVINNQQYPSQQYSTMTSTRY